MGLWDNSGVQMMLKNMLQAAAPELASQVDAVAVMVQTFDQRMARVEAQNAQIISLLTTGGNGHGERQVNGDRGDGKHATDNGAG